ncbi:MAG: hypothetical protein IPL87_00390 [Candidatus Moraniibacteriota bacterium]|nr:MAG: hypothetical protein IPL87_00390 [Candidatus Moranbacteria bacterium]
MYASSLEHIGLRPEQALIYESLMKSGPSSAGEVHKAVPLKRGLVYKVLDELVLLGLVEKKRVETEKTIRFEVCHPLKLKAFSERRETEAKNATLALEGVLPSLISDYNLVLGQPGVLVFEGLSGVKKVLEDNLDHNPEKKIFTFSDLDGYTKYLTDWNKCHYAPKRKRLGIYEKALVSNTEQAREFLKNYEANEFTEILLIDYARYPMKTEVNIYSGKVSFVTFSENSLIGVIIDNREIHDTLLTIWKLAWDLGRKSFAELQPSWTQRFGA